MLSTRRTIKLFVMLLLAVAVWSIPTLRSGLRAARESEWVAGVPGRVRLFCIANHDGMALPDDVLPKINAAFAKVAQHPEFARAGLDVVPPTAADTTGQGDPRILAGCPSRSTLNSDQWGRYTVTRPGPVQTYVFIVAADELKQTEFKHYPRVVGQEQICGEGVCNSVANAVYITPDELNEPAVLEQALTAGLGLPLTAEPIYIDGVTPDQKPGK